MATTRQQAEELTAYIATMTPANDAEAALINRATQTPDQVATDILDTPADATVTTSEGTVTTYDLFTPAQIADAGTRQEQPVADPETVPHTITVTTIPAGREYDWPHPDNCPHGDTCDILRRVRRNRSEYLVELVDGRPDGTYRLGRLGFHGLLLIDQQGSPLPDVVEALDPAATAAWQIAADVIRELAEAICEDTKNLVELCEIIRRGQTLDHWEGAANDAINSIINEHLGTMRAFAEPIRRILPNAAA